MILAAIPLALLPFLDWFEPAPARQAAPALAFVTTEGETRSLTAFRGRWVLLVVGDAHCRRTANTARIFHRLIQAMPGDRLVLVELLNEPTIADAELLANLPARWIRAIPVRGTPIAFYWRSPTPGWYLIDPEGFLRDSGPRLPADTLRRRVLEAFDEPGAAPPVLSDEEKLLDRATDELFSRDFEEADRTLSAYLERNPRDEFAIRLLLNARGWVQSDKSKVLDELESRFAEQLAAGSRLRLHFDIYRHFYRGIEPDRKVIRAWAARHPEVRFLEAIRISITKLPEDVTREEELTLLQAREKGKYYPLSHFLGYVSLARGAPHRAWEFQQVNKKNDRLGLLPRMLSLRDMGRPDEAWELTGYGPDFDLASAGRADVWRFMHASAILDRWEQVAAAACRYREQRPEWAQGPLMLWLATAMLGDEEETARARDEALGIIREKDRYAKYRTMLEEGMPEDPDIVSGIVDHNVRWDMVLAVALLEHRDRGWEGFRKALDKAQPGFPSGDFYPLALHLRTRARPATDAP